MAPREAPSLAGALKLGEGTRFLSVTGDSGGCAFSFGARRPCKLVLGTRLRPACF